MKIGQDHARFKKIIKGKIKKNLRKFIKKGEMIGRVGKKTVSIPIPNIDIPRFRFDPGQAGGIGQGNGEIGDGVGNGPPQPGQGEAGDGEGDHAMEVEISLDELADILGEELELPNIEPKGDKNIEVVRNRYTGIRNSGPEGLKHFKRTYKRALVRQISMGGYSPGDAIIPQQSDKRYKHFKTVNEPQAKAVIIYMMDVSGSMGEAQKEIVRTESFWIDTWIGKQYKGLERRFIIHDSVAREVDRETFFSTRESGGTIISSALKLCVEMIEKDYPSSDWNVYPFHFSDGDNWSSDDNELCMNLIKDCLVPWSNQFSYGQVESQYGSGQFINELKQNFGDEPKVVLSEIPNKEEIMGSIKEFLGKGR